MDLVAIGQELGTLLPTGQSLIAFAILSILFALLFLSNTGRKLREQLAATVFSNWRLALLGATGIILSIASGWTTWDGMRNFTQEPILSLMITFGIQGVMLIVAWLIGESFATGMNFRPTAQNEGQSRSAIRALQPLIGSVIGILLFSAIVLLILNQVSPDLLSQQQLASNNWILLPDSLLLAAVGILLSATLLMNAGSDIVGDYLQAARVIVRSAVLWVMFLACMATSVFFSFDSLFSTIFPQRERVRAAELRAQNQVAGIVNDIGSLATRRRIEERDRLFEAEGWQQYDQTLARLVTQARQAPEALQQYFETKMRERQKIVARRQEEKSAAEGQQVRLTQRSTILNDQISRAKGVVAQLNPVVEDLKAQIFAKDRETVAKTAEAEAEAGGIGITAKTGRGPKYREITAELRVLREQKKNLQLQLSEYEKRLTAARADISRGESELSTAQGELATLKGRAETASHLITLAEQTNKKDGPSFDPTNGLKQLERARIAFRQDPTQPGLAQIQRLCTTLLGAMTEVPTLKAQSQNIDCDPGSASEAAERVFALTSGIKALAANCVGGDKLPKSAGTDGLFRFARQCVQDAGLPSQDTAALRTNINYLELNRDDKAHRFVVTTNAFQDGNKLAYLALAIAIAIDALVFMSGLFGANAVRSPLSDVPSHKGRSAQQLEAIIDTALQPHAYETARLVLGAMKPITQTAGFTARVVVADGDPHAADLRRVLNAGSSIGAVRHGDDHDHIYEVRAELFEYLSIVAKREYEKDKSRMDLAELERTVSVALLPEVGANAEMVLSHMHPIVERHGFMAEIKLAEVAEPADLRTLRNALNAGSVYERVQRAGTDASHFYIHSDFFKSLTALRGRLMLSAGDSGARPIQLEAQDTASEAAKSIIHERPALPQDTTRSDRSPQWAEADEPPPTRALRAPRDRAHFLNGFLAVLGIQPANFTDLSGEAFSAALAAAGSFAELRQRHPSLNRYLEIRERDKREIFEQANQDFEQSIADRNSSEWTELDFAYQDLSQNWQVVVLLPGGPFEDLMDRIVQELETDRAADTLSPEDAALLTVAQNVLGLLQDSTRQSTADWSNLGGAFQNIENGSDNIRPFPNVASN